LTNQTIAPVLLGCSGDDTFLVAMMMMMVVVVAATNCRTSYCGGD
jgi:hypothetical protein